MGTLWEYKTEWITGTVIMFLLYFFLKYLFPLVSPFLLSFLTVYTLFPFLYKMEEKRKIKKPITMILIFLVVGAILGGAFAVCIYFFGGSIQSFLESFIQNLPDGLMDQAKKYLPDIMVNSVSVIQKVIPVFAFIGIYVIATILLSKDFEKIMENVKKIGALDAFMTGMEKVIHTLAAFLKAQGIIILINATICSVGLWISGLKFGVVWGILAGVLDALPFIGTGIVLWPAAAWLFFSGNGWGALIALIAYVLCVMAREFLEPKLMGNDLGVYPVVVLFSIFAGVHLFGVSGIIKGPLGVLLYKYLFLAFLRQRVDK